MKSPIFVFSLPRAGSTLIQRVLMSHQDVSSVAEPWIMLPFCYAKMKNGIFTEYNQSLSSYGIEDFIYNLPNKEEDYYQAIHNMLFSLYEKQCKNNEKYFLDKTPRYYLIIPEILKIFPDAKFIFLFRNPIHIYASLISTFANNRFKGIYNTYIDLYSGPKLLSDAYSQMKDKSIAIRYEDFVKDPKGIMRKISEYLEIDFDQNILSNFVSQDTKGRLGDPTGVKNYKQIEKKSLDKWKSIFSNSFRKKIIFKYIQSLDEATLQVQGYNKDKLLMEIDSIKVASGICLRDRLDYYYSTIIRIYKPNIFLSKSKNTRENRTYIS